MRMMVLPLIVVPLTWGLSLATAQAASKCPADVTQAKAQYWKMRVAEAISKEDKKLAEAIGPTDRKMFVESLSPEDRKLFAESISPMERKLFAESISPKERQQFAESLSPADKKLFAESVTPAERKQFAESISKEDLKAFAKSRAKVRQALAEADKLCATDPAKASGKAMAAKKMMGK